MTTENRIEQHNFILTIHTDSPVIITVPHDGVVPRQYLQGLFAERVCDVERDVRIARDVRVFPIVKDILLKTPVNVVFAMIHRAYIDFNRPTEIGVLDENLRYIYDEYHKSMSEVITRCKAKHDNCLLIDFHGCADITMPGLEQTDIILGTSGRRSVFSDVDLELERWLINKGYRVLVANEEMFQGLFTGRYNVIDYSQQFRIDSILIEITRRYRARGAATIGKKLAEDLGEFIEHITTGPPSA